MDDLELSKLKKISKTLNILYVSTESQKIKQIDLNYLKDFFNEVICSNDGIDALNKMKNNEISIVITDIQIPSINGFDLIEEMKASYKNLITIIYTNETTQESLLKSINLGIDGYLFTPLNKKEFLNILSKSLKKIKINKENKKIKKDLKLLKQYHEIVNKSTIISKVNKEGIITYVNDNFCKVSEYNKEELIGQHHTIIEHPDNVKGLFDDLWHTIRDEKKEWHGTIKNISKSGKTYYVKTTMKPILSNKGEVVEYIDVKSNISTIMSDKKNLIDEIESNNLSLLVLIQIEEFDMLDKFYNIETVNNIEKVFGTNLLDYLPQGYIFDNIYNIGNGRFALLTDFFSYSNSHQNLNQYLKQFVQNVKESLLTIDDIEYDLNIVVSYSFGKIHLFEDAKCGLDDAITKKEMINFANDYSIREHVEAKKNIEVMKMVKIALDNFKIVSYFQPIINNKTQEIEKYESLVRLVDENGKVLAPATFLDISKKGTYYNKITHRVLENSFKILEHISTKISINLSSRDIEKEETREKLFELLKEHKKDAHRIVFELLEDEEVKNFKVIRYFIRKVKRMGVKIAIDDFGAGYSNFERLLDFEPDILKIDGSLIKNIVKDTFSRNIVETIVSFAKKQKIETVAEYVENEEIFNILNELGVDYSQGYYFGKPENITIDYKHEKKLLFKEEKLNLKVEL